MNLFKLLQQAKDNQDDSMNLVALRHWEATRAELPEAPSQAAGPGCLGQ